MREERIPQSRYVGRPDPRKSATLPDGSLISRRAAAFIPSPCWRLYFTLSATSPIPVELWSYGTFVERTGFSESPPK